MISASSVSVTGVSFIIFNVTITSHTSTGINLPIITFSLSPSKSSRLPLIVASVSTRVVSWNDAR